MSPVKPYQRILVPTDFSENSTTAFQHAESIAAITGASIVVLHAFDVPDAWGTGGRPEEIDQETKQRLQAIRSNLDAVKVKHVAHGGAAGDVICWIAQEEQCDLIVMGTHGRTGLTHLVMGSVAEHVIRHARCPVLTVRQGAENEPRLKEPEIYVPMPPIM